MSVNAVDQTTGNTTPLAGNTNNLVGNLSALTTNTKSDAVGAINEVNQTKQNATDNNLQTTDKTIVGGINELRSGLTDIIVSDIKSSAGQTVAAGDDSMFTIDVTKQGYTPIFYTAINTQNSRLLPYYYALNGNTLSVALHNSSTGSIDGAVSALVLYRRS